MMCVNRTLVLGWFVGGLLAIQGGLLAYIAWESSPNRTEIGHIGAAFYLWKTGKFDVFNVNPPLTRMIVGLAVGFAEPKWNWKNYSASGQERREWGLGNAFVKANRTEDVQWYFALARWVCVPLVLLGGYVGYGFASEIYGRPSGTVFLTLWAFSPFILGWGATICPDVTSASMGIVGAYSLWHWLKSAMWGDALLAGLCLGLLPLSKTTWIVAFGLWPVLWFAWHFGLKASVPSTTLHSASFHQLCAVTALAFCILNLGYGFDGSCQPLGEYQFISRALAGIDNSERIGPPVGGNRFAGTWLGVIPVPLPADFVQGVDTQRYDFERGLPSYLRGQWANHGWWYYYLYALAIKLPLGTWVLVVLAIGVIIFDWRRKKPSPPAPLPKGERRLVTASWRDEMVVLVPGLVILIFVSSQTGFSVHSRYIIPALPFLFVWTSKVARVFEMRPFTRKQLAMAAMVVLALIWSVGSSLAVYPHSLSYFNELAAILPTPADASYPKPVGGSDDNRSVLSTLISAGPRNGPRHLLDSNIDWGQDLFYLKGWLDEHLEAKLDGLAYYGSYPATLAGIPETPSPPIAPENGTGTIGAEHPSGRSGQLSQSPIPVAQDIGPKPGWYALSVNYIYDRSHQYRYFLNFEPVAMAGYSIYIYHVTLGEANQVRRRLGMAELTEERKMGEGRTNVD